MEVHKCRHILLRAGQNVGHCVSDLVFLEGVPHIVIEWEDRPAGQHPAVTVKLDPEKLHPLNWPEVKYLYELPVEDPRSLD